MKCLGPTPCLNSEVTNSFLKKKRKQVGITNTNYISALKIIVRGWIVCVPHRTSFVGYALLFWLVPPMALPGLFKLGFFHGVCARDCFCFHRSSFYWVNGSSGLTSNDSRRSMSLGELYPYNDHLPSETFAPMGNWRHIGNGSS